ncbi:hypothetical protein OLZ33_00450 [Pantoea ananatis]|uniref:hypothetical protein n=1 Tax=Pantoea ananas TaxID=553 RepID=UPI00158968F3|nr:hypothetical protein [Pantoea ananatis]MBA4820142.1 hypothetical protein [Pantoea ananatis]MCW1830474.1 hypothetical protein [Pantoea ananatis]QKV90110.1 hypothetical protein FOB88_24775 [Pantoea ananatis]
MNENIDFKEIDYSKIAELNNTIQGRKLLESLYTVLVDGVEKMISELTFDLARQKRESSKSENLSDGNLSYKDSHSIAESEQAQNILCRDLAEKILTTAFNSNKLAGSENNPYSLVETLFILFSKDNGV